MSVEVHPLSAVLINAVAAVSATALVLTPVAPPGDLARPASTLSSPAIVLSAQMLPLPIELLHEQIAFNVGLAVNFVTTGVELVRRIADIPGTFASDVRAGTSVPTAAVKALKTFADIEFEAGRDLVGYGQDIADFQIRFAARVLSALPPFASGAGAHIVSINKARALNTVQQIANSSRSTIDAVQQVIDNALRTPKTATNRTRSANNAVAQHFSTTTKTLTRHSDQARPRGTLSADRTAHAKHRH